MPRKLPPLLLACSLAGIQAAAPALASDIRSTSVHFPKGEIPDAVIFGG